MLKFENFCWGLFLACACSLSFAQPLVSPHWIISGTYIGAFGGYASVDWANFSRSPFLTYSTNAYGAANFGVDVGYRFYSFFALEGGWIWLPTVKGFGTTTLNPNQPMSMGVSQWVGYLAGKLYATVTDHFYLFLGAGAMYRQTLPTPSQYFTNSVAYYYSALGLLGAEWYFKQNWSIFMEYFYVPEYNNNLPTNPVNVFNVPTANLVELGLSYKFSI